MAAVRNYLVQSDAVEMLARMAQLCDPTVMLRERQGKSTGGPSGPIHREVKLRPVITMLSLDTGEEMSWYVCDASMEEHQEFVSELNIVDSGRYLYTTTEEEYDDEQAA